MSSEGLPSHQPYQIPQYRRWPFPLQVRPGGAFVGDPARHGRYLSAEREGGLGGEHRARGEGRLDDHDHFGTFTPGLESRARARA